MPALVAGIHVFFRAAKQVVDARNECGMTGKEACTISLRLILRGRGAAVSKDEAATVPQ